MFSRKKAHIDKTPGIEHIDGLYGYALVLTRNRSDAEDLVQETYVRAIQATNRLTPDSNLRAWMFTILRNVWLNEVRRRRKAPEVVDIHADERTSTVEDQNTRNPYDSYTSEVERHQVQRAIRELPADAREVILLREYEDLSYQEIARVLNCPVGTVMSRLARARSKLRETLSSLLYARYSQMRTREVTK